MKPRHLIPCPDCNGTEYVGAHLCESCEGGKVVCGGDECFVCVPFCDHGFAWADCGECAEGARKEAA